MVNDLVDFTFFPDFSKVDLLLGHALYKNILGCY